MIIIEHILPTGKKVTDKYYRAVEQKIEKGSIKLIDRYGAFVAIFHKSNVINIEVVPY